MDRSSGSIPALATTAALVVLLLVAAPVSAKDERIVLEQDEYGWEFERSNTLCVARGRFEGEGRKTAYLELRKDSPADLLKVLLATEGLRMPRLDTLPSYRPYYRLNLEDAQQRIVTLAPSDASPRRLVSMFEVNLTAPSPELSHSGQPVPQDARKRRIDQIDGLHIDGLFSQPVSFAMESFANLSAQFDDCTDRILRTWNLDPEQQRSLTRAASLANLPELMTDLQEKMRKRNRATVSQLVYTAVISASGQLTRCHVLPPASADLGEIACSALQETGRFDPALDANGQPAPSYMTGRVIFRVRG